jgi:hypothetical protein
LPVSPGLVKVLSVPVTFNGCRREGCWTWLAASPAW